MIRHALVFILMVGMPCIGVYHEWQRLNDPSTSRVAGRFHTPPSEYGMVLWWGWDGPVNGAVIERDLDFIKSRGFACVMIEAGYGMSAP